VTFGAGAIVTVACRASYKSTFTFTLGCMILTHPVVSQCLFYNAICTTTITMSYRVYRAAGNDEPVLCDIWASQLGGLQTALS